MNGGPVTKAQQQHHNTSSPGCPRRQDQVQASAAASGVCSRWQEAGERESDLAWPRLTLCDLDGRYVTLVPLVQLSPRLWVVSSTFLVLYLVFFFVFFPFLPYFSFPSCVFHYIFLPLLVFSFYFLSCDCLFSPRVVFFFFFYFAFLLFFSFLFSFSSPFPPFILLSFSPRFPFLLS